MDSARNVDTATPRPRGVDPREAWRRKYARQPAPWSGPVHAAPMLADLRGRVVELGAGGGKVAAALDAGLAVDWVREGLDPARPAVQADVRRLPFQEGSIDALVALHVLGHLLAPDRAAAVAEWWRVLRPGGSLVLEAFATGDAREGTGRQVEAGTWEREGIATHHFDADEVAALLHGWEGAPVVEERRQRWGVRRVVRGRFRKPYGDAGSKP